MVDLINGKKYDFSTEFGNYSIITPSSIEEMQQLAKIETYYFNQEEIASPEITHYRYKHNPDGILAIKDNSSGLIIGDISILPVSVKLYNTIIEGNDLDTLISTKDILLYDKPGFYKIYFCVAVILPEYKNKGLIKLLVRAYYEKFKLLEKRGIFISDVIADTITEDGNNFSIKAFGMKFLKNSNHNSKIMYVSGKDFFKSMEIYLENKFKN